MRNITGNKIWMRAFDIETAQMNVLDGLKKNKCLYESFSKIEIMFTDLFLMS